MLEVFERNAGRSSWADADTAPEVHEYYGSTKGGIFQGVWGVWQEPFRVGSFRASTENNFFGGGSTDGTPGRVIWWAL